MKISTLSFSGKVNKIWQKMCETKHPL